MSVNKSSLIAIEGLEGAGKSTLIAMLKKHFKDNNIDNFRFTKEPGGTVIADDIRSLILKKDDNEQLHSKTELLLMYASRIQHIEQYIKPAMLNNKHVISDRFNWSSFAYQGGGRELSLSFIQKLDALILSEFQSNFIIFLDVSINTGLKRVNQRNVLQNLKSDRIELEKRDFFQRARDIFLKLCKDNTEKSCIIDANLSTNEVFESVISALKNKNYL